MWVSRKAWDGLVARVEELERSTGMTSFPPSGWIGHWMKAALPINVVVEELAKREGLRHHKRCIEEWTTDAQSAAHGGDDKGEKNVD